MKKLCILIATTLISNQALAEATKCSLTTGREVARQSIEMKGQEIYEEKAGDGAAGDLFFYMDLDCDITNCVVSVTIDSGIAESEVGQIGAHFQRGHQSRTLIDKPLTNTPDGKNYQLKCEYIGKN